MTTTSALAFVRGEDEGETTGDIYQQPDPRGYFRVMFGLDYVLPDIATSVFRQLITARRTALGRRIKIVDIGCGYATNAALIRFPLDMDDLAHRYRDLDHSELSAERLIELDQHFFKAWPSSIDADFVGFDIHAPALDYAKCVGLVADVVCCDFAQDVLSDADRRVLSGADLIISTTAADFLDEDRFGLLLDAVGGDPWCAVFGLRVSPMFELEAAAKARGLVSERLEGTTFVQRRFATSQEWTQVLLALETQGIATVGKESEGLLHSEFFLMRREAEAAERPVHKTISLSRGQERSFAGWRRRPWGV